MKSYSQFGEDLIIDGLLQKAKGMYIDVGAADGIASSNTYFFYLAGWTGYCLEPHSQLYEMLKRNRPKDVCMDVALSSIDGKRIFYEARPATFSSLVLMDRIRENVTDIREVQVMMLSQFQVLFDHLDLLSVDAEGHDLEVLQGMDMEGNLPDIIVVEYSKPVEIEEFLKPKYVLHQILSNVNAIFTLRS